MRTLQLYFLACLYPIQSAAACHPTINPLLAQYIIGYGSLINEASKKRTDLSAQQNFPVLIKGYQRSWSVHGNLPGLNATFLSVHKDKNASFNGVIYKLSRPEHIEKYDARETIYCRKALSEDELVVYKTKLPIKKQIWIYISDDKTQAYPAHDFPIVQSYVDIFIRGCIQIQEKFKLKHFAKDCIQTTAHWSSDWENDRIFPRRPFLYEPYAAKIDDLLKKNLPKISPSPIKKVGS